jgi:hypothetical protein
MMSRSTLSAGLLDDFIIILLIAGLCLLVIAPFAPRRAFFAAARAGYRPCIPAAATATAVAAARVPTSSLP